MAGLGDARSDPNDTDSALIASKYTASCRRLVLPCTKRGRSSGLERGGAGVSEAGSDGVESTWVDVEEEPKDEAAGEEED